MRLKPDPRTPERHTKCLRGDHPLHKAMYDDAGLQRLYKTLHGYNLVPTAFPVEVRRYPAHSAGMGWHRPSDVRRAADRDGLHRLQRRCADAVRVGGPKGHHASLKPRKNDLVLVKPNQALHRVTGLGEQTRGILKWIAHAPKASPLPSMKFEKRCPFRTLITLLRGAPPPPPGRQRRRQRGRRRQPPGKGPPSTSPSTKAPLRGRRGPSSPARGCAGTVLQVQGQSRTCFLFVFAWGKGFFFSGAGGIKFLPLV